MREKLLIYGAGGLTMQLFASLNFEFDNKFDYVIYDGINRPFKFLGKYLTYNVIPKDCNKFCLCISGTEQRQLITSELLFKGLNPIIYSAVETPEQFIKLKGNNLILQQCVIEPNVEIGFGTMINVNNNIFHGCKIGSFCEICPSCNILGDVKIGSLTFIGANTTILPKVEIGKNCIIGANSLVNKNIPDNYKAYGSPIKLISKLI